MRLATVAAMAAVVVALSGASSAGSANAPSADVENIATVVLTNVTNFEFNLYDCPAGEDAYRMPHLVADTVGLVDALGRERCHLAGHDWGALVGWAVASAHPERLLTWSAGSTPPSKPAAWRARRRCIPTTSACPNASGWR